tara:strand:- start:760 stop:1305 length:546 start_codon:yes stop_codon:yes gene_type:complete
MSKLKIRRYFLKKRDEISVKERILLSSRINRNLLQQEEFIIAKNIASFKTFRNEPQLTQAKNKFYFYPKIVNSELSFHSDKKGFKPNRHGIEEPIEKQSILLQKIDIFLVPLISFNKNLHRIGFGGGYYDRTLKHLLQNGNKPKFWGIGYDFQLSESNFESEFDVRLDKVISDKKVYVSKI